MAFTTILLAASCLTAQTQLPEATGNAAVKKVCAGCHEITTVIAVRRTQTGWEQVIGDMVTRGAEGTDEELESVLSYLTKWFGKVNVNTASPDDLQKVLGLSAKEAQAVVSFREKNGKYKNFEELLKAPGIAPEKLRDKRSLIAFSQ